MLQNIPRRIINRLTRAVPAKMGYLNLDRPIASFTFDDFARSAWTEGGPLVEAFGGRATYYVSGGLCNQVHDGALQFGEEDLIELVLCGHDLGCHTYDHCRMPYVSMPHIEASLAKNFQFLRRVTGVPAITSLAYPYGLTAPLVKSLVGRKFPVCRGVYPGVNTGVTDLTQISAIGLHVKGLDIEYYIEKCLRQNGWLVFVGHDVSDKPTPFGCTPQHLEAVLKTVSKAGIEIQTIDAVARRFLGGYELSISYRSRGT